jgi:Xaa-Pro aminopeptidase
MGSGANGAIIHYHPSELRPALVSPDAMLLVDSGGHYTSGTTDVTRTIHTGTPTAHQKRCYTRVLQGHVDMARAVVSSAVRGEQLDILARLPLFADGLDYRHGTGHGVGAYLNVHESPPSVNGGRGSAHYDGPLLPGFIFSDEPGYYESGAFGIRIESLLLANPVATRHTFHSPYYLGFENLTLVPFSRQLIEAELLSREQVEYIDAFHRRCREQVGPRLAQRDPKAHRFLMRETRPLRTTSRLRLPPAALPLIITASAALVFGAYLFGSSRAASSSPK